MSKTKDFLDQMMDYESGELNDADTLQMFSTLTKEGLQHGLQGHYGRAIFALIQDGWLDREGNILKKLA
jgi:hypothetical protein